MELDNEEVSCKDCYSLTSQLKQAKALNLFLQESHKNETDSFAQER